MEAQVSKWGNSLGIRIPAVLAKELGLEEGSAVDLALVKGGLFLRKPVHEDLETLLSKISAENRHGESDWEDARGVEAW